MESIKSCELLAGCFVGGGVWFGVDVSVDCGTVLMLAGARSASDDRSTAPLGPNLSIVDSYSTNSTEVESHDYMYDEPGCWLG
jgi:hypothetical protein